MNDDQPFRDTDIAVDAPSLLPLQELIAEIQKRPQKTFWRTTEIAALRAHYPIGGIQAVVPLLPGRTRRAIYSKAGEIGLNTPATRNRQQPVRRYPNDPRIDALLVAHIPACTKLGDISRLADMLDRPNWWINKRASQLGLTYPRRMPDWTREEDAVLRELAGKPIGTIRRKLLAATGAKRTETAIRVRLKRLGESLRDPEALSAHEMARLMGLCNRTVLRWIEEEGLPARKTGDGRAPWQIDRSKLRRWFATHAILIDLRKVDRFWFIETVCG